jgi:hypothetical protein
MDPLLIIGAIVAAAVALYFLLKRPVKNRGDGGRPDETERPELTGPEQHKRRELR